MNHAVGGVNAAKEALSVGFVTILLPGLAMGAVLAVLAWGGLRIIPERFHPTEGDPVATMVGGIILIFAFVLGLSVSQEVLDACAGQNSGR
jgi:hypothetical protein